MPRSRGSARHEQAGNSMSGSRNHIEHRDHDGNASHKRKRVWETPRLQPKSFHFGQNPDKLRRLNGGSSQSKLQGERVQAMKYDQASILRNMSLPGAQEYTGLDRNYVQHPKSAIKNLFNGQMIFHTNATTISTNHQQVSVAAKLDNGSTIECIGEGPHVVRLL